MREWLDRLEDRSKAFSIAAVRFAHELEDTRAVPRSVVWQFVASATSVGANHRAARQARSDRELTAKLGLVVEEADETVFWLELIEATAKRLPSHHAELAGEARELKAVFARILASMRARAGRDGS
jgi:four helix bundle protein